MKYFFALALILAFVVFIFYPPVNDERKCYDTSRVRLEQIATNVFNQRISRDKECGQTMDVLYDLELCMQEATKSSTIAIYANDTIQRLVTLIRPYAKSLWTMKEEHNQSCENYSWYMLP